MKRVGLTTTAGYLLLVLAWAIVTFYPLVVHPASTLPDDGDALQGVAVLGWVAHQIVRAPLEVFDMYLYYPHPKGLVYSEHLIPQGLVAAIFVALGASIVVAANLLVILGVIANALALFLWARELGASLSGAAVAGLVCAFGTSIIEEAPRLQSLWMYWIPLSLYFLHRFFRTGSRKAAWGFAACFVMQCLSGQYYLVSLPIYLLPVGAGYLYAFPERRSFRDFARLAAPTLLLSFLLVPIEWTYLKIFTHYRFDPPLTDGTDLVRFVVPPGNSLLYGKLFGSWVSTTVGQKNHFAGFIPLALGLVGAVSLVRERSRDARTWRSRFLIGCFGITGLMFMILSAGPVVRIAGATLGPGPFHFVYNYVPFFDYTRVPERLNVYWVLGLSLLCGYGASTLTRRMDRRPVAAIFLGAILLVAIPAEHLRAGRHTRIPSAEEFPEVYRYLAELPDEGAVVELPVYPRRLLRFFGYETYFGTASFTPRVFGKASFTPPALEVMLWTLRDFPSREATRLLQSLEIARIIYHPYRDDNAQAVVRRLRRDPNFRLIRGFEEVHPVAARLGFGGELVYEVIPASMPPQPVREDERPVPRDRWSFETSSDADPYLAVDGRGNTAWSSEARQRKGQFFDVNLDGEHWVSRISLGFLFPYSEFPRALAINGYHSSHRWRRLQFDEDPWRRARLARELVNDPANATMDFVLEEPMLLQRVRLFIRETDITDDLPVWRIPEIQIFEVPQP